MSAVLGVANRSTVPQDSRTGNFTRTMLRSVIAAGAVLAEMSFLDHLEELRRRLIRALVAVGAGMGICFIYTAELIKFLNGPAAANGIPLIAVDATEVFSLYFKVAATGGICLAMPFILWQIWRFIEPALYSHERRYALPFLISTTICFILGAVFGYTVVVPWLLILEKQMAEAAGITLTMSAESYFSILTMTVVSIGAVFEMPPIVFVLSRIGLVTARFLVRNFQYAIVIFSIAAAILTPSTTMPPMIAFMGVMVGIYVVSIVVAWVFGKSRTVSES